MLCARVSASQIHISEFTDADAIETIAENGDSL